MRDQCPNFFQHWCASTGFFFPDITVKAAYPTLATHSDRLRIVNLKHHVSDAILIQVGRACIVLFELVRTIPGRALREAVATATEATVSQDGMALSTGTPEAFLIDFSGDSPHCGAQCHTSGRHHIEDL